MTLSREAVLPAIRAALREDIGPKDITTAALVGRGVRAEAELVFRQEGVVAGLNVAEWTFQAVDPRVRFKPSVRDGAKVFPGKVVAYVEGPATGMLTAERTALNFLSRMSGVATLTRRFVKAVEGTRARIFDTRKTTPGLRLFEKYAVAVAGGCNHRMSLSEGVLIKDNHLRLFAHRLPGVPARTEVRVGTPSPVEEAVRAVRRRVSRRLKIEVEVTSLTEFRQALAAGAEIVLLDNMKAADAAEAVRLRDAFLRGKGRENGSSGDTSSPSRKRAASLQGAFSVLLEVSGGVTLENVRTLARTGVDRISVGALTRSAPGLDVALEFVRARRRGG